MTEGATTVRAGVVGNLEKFDPKNDTMAAYIERAAFHMDANNAPDKKKAARFLSALGKSTFQVLRNLVAPDKVKDKTFDDITAVLLQHYKLKPLVISECFNFNRRKQAANELVADCVAELRRLSAHCEFGTFLDDGLRDRFVCGLRSEAVQKLLVEISLTFTCAVEIAQNMESAASKVKQLQSQSNADVAQRGVYKMSGEAVTGNNSCYRCGRQNHQPSHCPFKSAKCHNCGKQGHIQPVCRKPKQSPPPYKGCRGNRHGGARGQGQPAWTVQEEQIQTFLSCTSQH